MSNPESATWLDKALMWLEELISGFTALQPTEQVLFAVGVLGLLSFSSLKKTVSKFKEKTKVQVASEPLASENIKSTSTPKVQESKVIDCDEHLFKWLYQWEIGDNVLPRSVYPSLGESIAQEIRQASLEGKCNFLIFVRGELGIGKSTLLKLLPSALKKLALELPENASKEKNFIETTTLLEAGDLTRPEDFATQIIQGLSLGGALVVLARPATLDLASRRIATTPDKVVNILPFEPTGPLFHECLTVVADRVGLYDERHRVQLGDVASRFDSFLKTPFYFEQAARSLKLATTNKHTLLSPLEVFRTAIEDQAMSAGISFEVLLKQAIGEVEVTSYEALPGISSDSGFIHDGYRNVIIASGVVSSKVTFENATRCENAIPAIRIVLSHLESIHRTNPNNKQTKLSEQIRSFIKSAEYADQRYFPIYISGLAAASFRSMKDEKPADVLRSTCIKLINTRYQTETTSLNDKFSLWWDISDALSEIGDPRLRFAKANGYSLDSGYFTSITKMKVLIGSRMEPVRTDHAKPVLCYKPSEVEIGPFYVSNFLVTNEQFLEFWDAQDREKYFEGTGRNWINQDVDLLERIEKIFDLTTRRNFWKEISDQDSITVGTSYSGVQSPLALAKKRAIHPHSSNQIPLWDPFNTDRRFSANGQPVVGINWWESMAYCRWWEQNKLKDSSLPQGSKVSLMTDWEWEAVRRYYYEDQDNIDKANFPIHRYPAHLRVPPESLHSGRIGNVMRPLHVGLSMPPSGKGPTDMIGNVWEWTRSRIFGEISSCEGNIDEFGNTVWVHGDKELEKNPLSPKRDVTNDSNDLHYRSVRGGSFFSRDPQAAWHPAYRLCDPPFSSYIDLGFRIAVYPPNDN